MRKLGSSSLPAVLVCLALVGLAGQRAAAEGPQSAQPRHLVLQLSTQQPSAPLPGAPDRVYPVDAYEQGSDIWVAVPPVVDGMDLSGTTVMVWVVEHRKSLREWAAGTRLKDLSGGAEQLVIAPGEAWDNYALAWGGAMRLGRYDLVVDREPFGFYEPGVDLLDHGALGGLNLLGPGTIDYLVILPDVGCTRIVGSGSYQGGLYEPTEPFVAEGWQIIELGDDINWGPVSAEWTTTVSAAVGRIHQYTGLYVAGNITGEGTVEATFPGATSDTAVGMTTAPSWVP